MTLDNILINIENLTTKQINKVIARLEAMSISIHYLRLIPRTESKFIKLNTNKAIWCRYHIDHCKILSYEEFLKIPVTWIQTNSKKEKAWKILSKYGWTQNAGSRDINGKPCGFLSKEAASFCLVGVCAKKNKVTPFCIENINHINDIKKLANVITKRAPYILEEIGKESSQPFNIVFRWNDNFCKSKEEAIEVLKEANV